MENFKLQPIINCTEGNPPHPHQYPHPHIHRLELQFMKTSLFHRGWCWRTVDRRESWRTTTRRRMGGAGWRSLNVCLWSICKTFWIIDDFVDFFYCYWCCGYPGACATAPPRRRGSWRLATRTTSRATPSLPGPYLTLLTGWSTKFNMFSCFITNNTTNTIIIALSLPHTDHQQHHCLASPS